MFVCIYWCFQTTRCSVRDITRIIAVSGQWWYKSITILQEWRYTITLITPHSLLCHTKWIPPSHLSHGHLTFNGNLSPRSRSQSTSKSYLVSKKTKMCIPPLLFWCTDWCFLAQDRWSKDFCLQNHSRDYFTWYVCFGSKDCDGPDSKKGWIMSFN